MRNRVINAIIEDLDQHQLIAIKTIVEAVLNEIERNLKRITTQHATIHRIQMDYQKFSDSAEIVARHLEKFGRLDQAIEATAHETGILPTTILEHWKIAEKKRKDITKAVRDRQILKMIKNGKSNQEIGQALNLHPTTVSKIISRYIGKRNKPKKQKTGAS